LCLTANNTRNNDNEYACRTPIAWGWQRKTFSLIEIQVCFHVTIKHEVLTSTKFKCIKEKLILMTVTKIIINDVILEKCSVSKLFSPVFRQKKNYFCTLYSRRRRQWSMIFLLLYSCTRKHRDHNNKFWCCDNGQKNIREIATTKKFLPWSWNDFEFLE